MAPRGCTFTSTARVSSDAAIAATADGACVGSARKDGQQIKMPCYRSNHLSLLESMHQTIFV
jgi:hypothetical protein